MPAINSGGRKTRPKSLANRAQCSTARPKLNAARRPIIIIIIIALAVSLGSQDWAWELTEKLGASAG
jgi:hypothetical protein